MRNEFKAWMLCFTLVVVAELTTRIVLSGLGRRWEYWDMDASVQFEYFRHEQEQNRTPRIVIGGDSTGHHDINAVMIERNSGVSVWNLASSGNFPMAFEESTLPLLESGPAPAILVISFIPTGLSGSSRLRASEASIVNSPYCRRRKAGWLVSDYMALAKIKPSLEYAVGWFEGSESTVVDCRGFAPLKGTVGKRIVSMRKNVSTDKRSVLNSRRTSVIEKLAVLSHRRGINLFVVIPPSLDQSLRRRAINEAYADFLKRKSERWKFRVINFSRFATERPNLFKDTNHLNDEGSQKMTAALLATLVNARVIASTPER